MRAVLSPEIAPPGGEAVLYVPSLRELPASAPLVMATLPVLDWNAAFVGACAALRKTSKHDVFAGLLMADPFACWEDIRDDLKRGGIAGVANFPSTTMVGGPGLADLDAAHLGHRRELDRLAWFAQDGFSVIGVVVSRGQAQATVQQLGPALAALCVVEAADLDRCIMSGVVLERMEDRSWAEVASVPVLRLGEPAGSGTTKSKKPRRSSRQFSGGS